jgi:hypothetical protein
MTLPVWFIIAAAVVDLAWLVVVLGPGRHIGRLTRTVAAGFIAFQLIWLYAQWRGEDLLAWSSPAIEGANLTWHLVIAPLSLIVILLLAGLRRLRSRPAGSTSVDA